MKIILSSLILLLIIGCSDEKKEIQKEVKQEVKSTSIVKIDKKIVEKKVPVQIKKKSVLKSINGAKIFAKCSSCHGKNAEKKALNKSQVIKGWNQEKIISAINGYRNGTYGSSMKGVMKPQVAKLTTEEIKAVSEYISKL